MVEVTAELRPPSHAPTFVCSEALTVAALFAAAGQAGGQAEGNVPPDAGAAADGGAGAQAGAVQAGGREEEPRRVHEEERRVHQPAGAGAREVSGVNGRRAGKGEKKGRPREGQHGLTPSVQTDAKGRADPAASYFTNMETLTAS